MASESDAGSKRMRSGKRSEEESGEERKITAPSSPLKTETCGTESYVRWPFYRPCQLPPLNQVKK